MATLVVAILITIITLAIALYALRPQNIKPKYGFNSPTNVIMTRLELAREQIDEAIKDVRDLAR